MYSGFLFVSGMLPDSAFLAFLARKKFFFLSHADRGRAQDDVGLMGETDLHSSGEKGTVN
jgi:hypothetical protein